MHVLADISDPPELETEDGSTAAEEQTPDETELFGIPLLGFRNHKTACDNAQDEADEAGPEPKKEGSAA